MRVTITLRMIDVFRTQSNIFVEAFFCENSKRLSTVNYFRKKGCLVDIRLGSKYAFIVHWQPAFLILPHFYNSIKWLFYQKCISQVTNSSDILCLYEINLDHSFHSNNFYVRGCLSSIWTDCVTDIGLAVYVKEKLPFARGMAPDNWGFLFMISTDRLYFIIVLFFFLFFV